MPYAGAIAGLEKKRRQPAAAAIGAAASPLISFWRAAYRLFHSREYYRGRRIISGHFRIYLTQAISFELT